jgi:Sap, sulfolipid-1-addressing protein
VLGLALAVMGIAVPDSLNPTLIIAVVILALGPRPFRSTLAFTLAVFVVTLAGGVVIALGLGDLILSLLPKLSRTLKYELMIAIGVALIVGGAVLWWRRSSLGESEPISRREPHDAGSSARGAGSSVLLGAGMGGVEFLTAFPYFAAIGLVVGASVPVHSKVILIVLYNVIYVLPLIAVVVLCAVMGERAGRLVAPVGDWIAMHWPAVVAPLAAAIGVALTAYGILQLV